jgi:hypothetical protein
MFCSLCGSSTRPTDRFCSSCGQALDLPAKDVVRCRSCLATVSIGSKFCDRCGIKLSYGGLEASIEGTSGEDVSRVVREILDTHKDSKKIRILFLAANPSNTQQLNLTNEVRRIDEELRKAKERDGFDLEQRHAVSLSDLQDLLLRFEPQIVHFSGHGNEAGELIFETKHGRVEIAPLAALIDLFRIVNGDGKKVQCVVLNACYSDRQAEAIAKHVPCVIGMSNAISDEAAIKFAASFYRGLGYGRSVNDAFELGCNDIALHNIPEEATPRLKYVQGVDPAKLFFSSSSRDKRLTTTGKPVRMTFYVWNNSEISRPPVRGALILAEFKEIRKALLSFKFDVSKAFGSKMDPNQPIIVNGKIVHYDLIASKKGKLVEGKKIDVTNMLKAGAQGAKNIIEFNYLLSPIAIARTHTPNGKIGKLTLRIDIEGVGRD